jgi:hypothetical protein
VANLWTTGMHDLAETGANTRPPASDLFRRLAAFTSRPFNEMRRFPPFVRNAEVGSSSLLPSTNLRHDCTRRLPAVALAEVGLHRHRARRQRSAAGALRRVSTDRLIRFRQCRTSRRSDNSPRRCRVQADVVVIGSPDCATVADDIAYARITRVAIHLRRLILAVSLDERSCRS